MTLTEIVVLEEGASTFAFSGFQPEEDRHLIAAVRQLQAALDEARTAAQAYYQDIRQLAGDYQWEKHYAHDPEQPDRTWLKPVKKLGP